MKSTMEFVEVAVKRKGMCKSINYYLGNVLRCNKLFDEMKSMFHYPGVIHTWCHEECRYLTILDLYNNKYRKKFADET